MRFIPHQYQLNAARFHLANPYSALFADPGLGKTAIMLMLLHELKRQGRLPPVLVLTTLRIATSVWPAEIAKWDQFQGLTCKVLHGPQKDAIAQESADIRIINNEGLKWAESVGILDKYKILIIDESSKYKGWSSQRTKFLRKRVSQFERRHILTGTPIPNKMMGLFAQMYLCDAGRSLGPYITHFRNKFFDDKGWGVYPDWQLKDGAFDDILARTAPRCIRLSDTELDMPDLIINKVPVILPPKYRQMSMQLLSELDLTDVISGASKYMASRRVAGGVLDGRVLHTAKLDAARDIIDELQGKQVLVIYYYRDEGDMLKRELGAQLIDGRTSATESERLIKGWNHGTIGVLGLQPAAGGHGLNLQHGGRDIICYSLTDNQDDYHQTIRRVWRQGVGGSVRVHVLLADGTVDHAIMAGLEAKTDFQAAFLKAIGDMNAKTF